MRLLFWLWQAACPLDAATASEEDVSFSHLFGVFLFLVHLQLPCRKSSPISSVALSRFSFDFEPWNPIVTVETSCVGSWVDVFLWGGTLS
jgi:hypothetical protein